WLKKTATAGWPSCYRLLRALADRDCGAGITHSQLGRVALSQGVYQLLMEVVVTGGHRRRYALVVHLPRAINVLAQAFVNVSLTATFLNFRFVVELDLRNKQASEAPRIVVQASFFFTDFDW